MQVVEPVIGRALGRVERKSCTEVGEVEEAYAPVLGKRCDIPTPAREILEQAAVGQDLALGVAHRGKVEHDLTVAERIEPRTEFDFARFVTL